MNYDYFIQKIKANEEIHFWYIFFMKFKYLNKKHQKNYIKMKLDDASKILAKTFNDDYDIASIKYPFCENSKSLVVDEIKRRRSYIHTRIKILESLLDASTKDQVKKILRRMHDEMFIGKLYGEKEEGILSQVHKLLLKNLKILKDKIEKY